MEEANPQWRRTEVEEIEEVEGNIKRTGPRCRPRRLGRPLLLIGPWR